MNTWCRLHNNLIDNRKFLSLPAESFRAFIKAMCLASKQDDGGKIGNLDDVSFAFHETKEAVSSAFHPLLEMGLIETVDETFQLSGWNKRQYKSDTSTARVRKHRGKRNVTRNVTETVTETPQNRTDSDSDTEQKKYIKSADQDMPEGWLDFHASYPKPRRGSLTNEASLRAYRKAIKKISPSALLDACKIYAASSEAITHPKGTAPWLNDERWTISYKPAVALVSEKPIWA